MSFSIATWNVNSIRARHDRLLAWLAKHRPDVLCLQETKVRDDDFPHDGLAQAGYVAVVHGQPTYNGVAVLARTAPLDVVRGFGDGIEDPQARFVVATVGPPHSPIRVASTYVPNGSEIGSEKFAYKLTWLERWRRWLDSQAAGGPPLLLCGDFNITPEDRDVFDPVAMAGQIHCHPDERAGLTRVRDAGFVDLFRVLNPDVTAYSWWDYRQLRFPRNQGFRIDHLFAAPALVGRCRSVVIDRDERKGKLPSDHAPVIATFD